MGVFDKPFNERALVRHVLQVHGAVWQDFHALDAEGKEAFFRDRRKRGRPLEVAERDGEGSQAVGEKIARMGAADVAREKSGVARAGYLADNSDAVGAIEKPGNEGDEQGKCDAIHEERDDDVEELVKDVKVGNIVEVIENGSKSKEGDVDEAKEEGLQNDKA